MRVLDNMPTITRTKLLAVMDFVRFALVMILVVFVVFNIAEAKRSSDSAKEAAREAKNTTAELHRFTEGVAGAVQSIKADNGNQTLILCKLILSENPRSLDDTEIAQVEAICQEKIDQFTSSATGSSTGTGASSRSSVPRQSSFSSSSNPTPNNPPPQSNNSQPEEDNEGVIVDLPLLPEIRVPSPF